MNWILPENQKDDVIQHVLELRKIIDHEKFLKPELTHLHDPFLMHDVEKASKIILKAIEEKKKIFIHGDFDVDGITATSIMWDFLYRKLGADAMPYIPSRFDEGYGLSEDSIDSIIASGGQMIITVDCGVKDLEIVSRYSDKIDFIITDHHTVLPYSTDGSLPKDHKKVADFAISSKALAVVHPKLPKYPFTEICGAMVSWKLCCGINKTLGNKFNVNEYLDLVSIGTICDVMPLVDENRVTVKFGLEQIKKTNNEGLKALFELAGTSHKEVKPHHIGYMIGPRLNAAGRIAHALDAVRLMSTSKKTHALELATKLNTLNLERQELTKKFFDIADEQASKLDSKIIFVYGEEWPEGIVGLIAGKLAQKYNKPVLVGSLNEGKVKGSARSIEALNIAETLKKVDKYLIRHGGHSQAAGFQLEHSALPAFQQELFEIVNGILTEEDLEKRIYVDYVTDLARLDSEFINALSQFEPFGTANKELLFAIMGGKIENYSTLGADKQHVKVIFRSGDSTLEVLQFNYKPETLETIKEAFNKKLKVDVAGYLENNIWNGNVKPQMKLVDLRISK